MSEENGTRLRVLLVEDEALVAMLIEDVLSEAGYQLVGAAPSLSAARAALERHGADMAILDVNLGGEPIFPFARALAEREIPFLFVTGYGEADIAPELRNRPVLRKPFRNAELLRAVSEISPVPS